MVFHYGTTWLVMEGENKLSRNGSGTMSVPYNDFVSGTTISSSQMDANFATIVSEITNSLPRDGQAAPTANLPMGGFKLTGLGNGSAGSDSATLGQVAASGVVWCGTAGGTADALTLTPSPTHTIYAAGKMLRFIAASTNTGAATVNVSALGAKNIYNNGAALAAGAIETGKIYEIVYDGTQFNLNRWFNPSGIFAALSGAAFTGNVSTTGTLGSTGDFKVNTDKFVVTASTGDTAVAGSLNATFYGTFGFGVAAGGGFVPSAGTLQAYRSITGGAPQSTGTTDSNQIAQIGAAAGGGTTRQGGYSTGDVWLQVSNNGDYATNYNLVVNPNGGGLAVGAAFAASQGKLQVKDSTIAGAGPEASGTTDANQVASFTASTAQIRMGFFNTGTAWIQASSSADYSTNYSLDFNPNGGAIFFPSVYSDTTASAANVAIAANGRFQRSTSSRKYKHDITDYTRGLADVMALRPVFYKGNNDGEKQFAGLIAEEVHDAGLTEFVVYADDGTPDALAYSNMVTLALKAIQQLKTENDALAARLTALEGK